MILSRVLWEIDKIHDVLINKIQAFNNHVNRSRSPSPFRDGQHSPRNPSPVMADTNGDCDIPIPIQYIGCQDLLELNCSHCGWLRKRRTISLFSWPQAYVVLHEGCLYYFKNERARVPAGRFSMYGYSAVYRASDITPKEAPWSFKIVHSHNKEFKTYYFSASSEQEMKIWMSKIKQEMLHANGKSAVYGKLLQHVKEAKPEKILDDPSFYQSVEENIYDDTEKFVLSKDYTKQCSIKRIHDDSDDEEIETNPSIDTRPPQPLPKGATGIIDNSFFEPPPLSPPSEFQPPSKPPRIVESKLTPPSVPRSKPLPIPPPVNRNNKPATPPSVPRNKLRGTPSSTNKKGSLEPLTSNNDTTSLDAMDVGLNKIQKMALQVEQQIENHQPSHKHLSPKTTRHKRREDVDDNKCVQEVNISASEQGQSEPRGSYEHTGGPGNKTIGVHGVFMVPDGSSMGSTGDDQQSDTEEDWSDIFFELRDKQKANEILQLIGEDGVYLVRKENTGEGMVLVVFVKDHSRKYRIMFEDGEYFIHREDFRHRTLETMIKHYYSNNLPTMSMMLKVPYKLHPAYKHLNL